MAKVLELRNLGLNKQSLNSASAVRKITSRKTDQESTVMIIKPPGGWEDRKEVIQGHQSLLLKIEAQDRLCSG